MGMTDANVDSIQDALVSIPMASGYFERVNEHEPRNPPGYGLTCAVWMERIGPAPARSGLASTTALMVWNARLYSSFVSTSPDQIDRNLTKAASNLFGRYAGGFTLGGLVCAIDLRGMAGVPLGCRAGYLTQDQKHYRIYDITIPVIVNDAWDEVP